eukprot:1566933-Pyramimonas_sp.AAC.1
MQKKGYAWPKRFWEEGMRSTSLKGCRLRNCKALIVDVRAASTYGQGFIEGSLNAPLYRAIQGWGLAANVRRTAFAFFGIYGSDVVGVVNHVHFDRVDVVVARTYGSGGGTDQQALG